MTDHKKNNCNTQASDSPTNVQRSRRKLLTAVGIAAATTVWHKPIINRVMLPAHAQTSICVADTSVGGPLSGHPSGAATCQAACEAEAASLNAQLCAVEEVTTATGTDCTCELDLP